MVGEENHLVIISKKFAFSNMIIQCSHHSFPQVRRWMTLNHLIERSVWIVNANVIVQRLIHKCVICRKLRDRSTTAKMQWSSSIHILWITYVWDNDNQSSTIRTYALWGSLHLCSVFSSVVQCTALTNTEVTNTGSFILALRRFMTSRSAVRSIN